MSDFDRRDDYYCRFLGILYVSSALNKRIKEKLDRKIDKLSEKCTEEFDKWLEENNLLINMGMVSKKD